MMRRACSKSTAPAALPPQRAAHSPGGHLRRRSDGEGKVVEAWPARERPVRERPILAEVHGEQNITARGLRVGVALGKGGNEVSSTRATEVVRQSSFASNQASFAGNENQRAIVDPEPWAKAVGRPPPPVAQAVPVNNRHGDHL